MAEYVVALDQGTTSSRAIVFNRRGETVSAAQYPLKNYFPGPGWVEQDPMEILQTQFAALRDAVERAGISVSDILSVGITNQRETTIVWDKTTGRPIYNAIVWQCRRTAELCRRLAEEGLEAYIHQTTGLLPDPYFSGTKIQWLLEQVPGAAAQADRGELLFGTVESWLIWNLTGEHITDYSNAGRTMLFDINRLRWDDMLCRQLHIPPQLLPRPVSNAGPYGVIKPGLPGLESLSGLPVGGAIGDQQGALLGQGCLAPGEAKNTYGTGCFTLMNTGSASVCSESGLVTSVAWSVNGKTDYALEGSVFNAGSSIQWLRDELGLISTAHECDLLAESVPDTGGVYTVSAFTGLGAPYWDAEARGVIVGLTRGTGRAHIARSVLEGIAYQVADLITCMETDGRAAPEALRVDGGASVSDFLMQFQADILQRPVHRPAAVESTALGAAFLAGLSAGLWSAMDEVKTLSSVDRVFTPRISAAEAQKKLAEWHRAVERSARWNLS